MNANARSVDAVSDCDIQDLSFWEAWDVWRREQDTASVQELIGNGDAAYHLRQAGVQAVIARSMHAWSTISVHRALLAGADVVEIAHVMGLEVSEVVDRWRRWATGQRNLHERCPRLGMKPHGFVAVAGAVAEGLSRDAETNRSRLCACAASRTYVGSPRP